MSIINIYLTSGINTGPFDLYENGNGYTTPFVTGILRSQIDPGPYTISSDDILSGTSIIRVQSTGTCTTSIDFSIPSRTPTPTPTGTPTGTPTTTSTFTPPSDCGVSHSDTYTGLTYFAYDNINVVNIEANSILDWTVLDRPNRFTVYQDNIQIATTNWVGIASYSGPWGASLSTATTGSLPMLNSAGDVVVLVEAGPADPGNPLTDAWSFTINCP